MPNKSNTNKSSGSKPSGPSAPAGKDVSGYRLAKDAGFDSVHHAGQCYGLKMHEVGAYDEARQILEALHDADQASKK